MSLIFDKLTTVLDSVSHCIIKGTVSGVKGLLIEAKGLSRFASIGSLCEITNREGRKLRAEVVGLRDKTILLMPFTELEGVGVGCEIELVTSSTFILPDISWKGRVIDCFGHPIDDKGALTYGALPYYLKASPPPAHKRKRVKDKLDMGVRSVNVFTSCCKGQRLGIFAGSGVGKSMLLSMFTKFAKSDIKVIGLIGERGREVREFLEDYLGEDGLQNAVVIVATSDESALARRQAAYMTMAVSEYFRDQNLEVLTMFDSVTRFAMALREIGLAAGEPPTSKGYTPSVFAELPKLLERSGPGMDGSGDITALFSTLVEGDDTNEPVADAIRSILDGHIVLSRDIAMRGRFPSVDVLASISRMMPNCNTPDENEIVTQARRYLASYDNISDLHRIGAYKEGTDKELDRSIALFPKLEAFLNQAPNEFESLGNSYIKLKHILEEQ